VRPLILPEVAFTGGLLVITLLAGIALGVPFSLPGGDRAAFVGIHYLYPLAGIVLWGAFALIGQRQSAASTFLVALPCYALVLLCHFNLKLWAPHINRVLWDEFYGQTDQAMRPVVDLFLAMRAGLAPVIPLDSNFYMIAFIAMFYISFCVHALTSARDFRTLFLAALFFQGSGALAYLVAPALGPFLHESGIEPPASAAPWGVLLMPC
jgi:hypothetical protein